MMISSLLRNKWMSSVFLFALSRESRGHFVGVTTIHRLDGDCDFVDFHRRGRQRVSSDYAVGQTGFAARESQMPRRMLPRWTHATSRNMVCILLPSRTLFDFGVSRDFFLLWTVHMQWIACPVFRGIDHHLKTSRRQVIAHG